MKTFLGLLMVLLVSGDDEVTVKGFVGGSVHLPCPCMKVNLSKEVKWQKDSPGLVVVSNKNQSFRNSYAGRVNMTLTNGSNNCSVNLKNITPEDHGKYTCIFYQDKLYKYKRVNLHVCGTSNISQQRFPVGNDVTVYQCNLEDCYEGDTIQWTLNGTLIANLINISNIFFNISKNVTLNNTTGLYNFSTSLSTKLSSTSNPECMRSSLGITFPIIQSDHRPIIDQNRMRFIVIPVVLVLGLSLIVCFLWKSHRVKAKNGQLERAYANCGEFQNESAVI